MTLQSPLAVSLAALSACVDDPDVNLETSVAAFAAAAGRSVHSYLGFSVHIVERLQTLAVTVLDDSGGVIPVRASLLIPPLRHPASGDPGLNQHGSPDVGITLYAAAAGAFVDLAADLAWLTDLHLSVFELDQHLPPRGTAEAATSVTGWLMANQAVGVLIASGLVLEEAEDELDAQAHRLGLSRNEAAVAVLAGLGCPPEVAPAT